MTISLPRPIGVAFPVASTDGTASTEFVRGISPIIGRLSDALGTATSDVAWVRAAGSGWIPRLCRNRHLAAPPRVRLAFCGGAPDLPARWSEEPTAVPVDMRVAITGPAHEFAVVDRSAALIAGVGEDGVPMLAVTSDLAVITLLEAVFESIWRDAVPISHAEGIARTLGDGTRRQIVEMLARGATDETISRSLGISRRTCARHVAQIMTDTGAQSRFQAGVRVAQLARLA